jgi:hypothetical protein
MLASVYLLFYLGTINDCEKFMLSRGFFEFFDKLRMSGEKGL